MNTKTILIAVAIAIIVILVVIVFKRQFAKDDAEETTTKPGGIAAVTGINGGRPGAVKTPAQLKAEALIAVQGRG